MAWASKPKMVEDAERILSEYCKELSLESISIFRKDGALMYSSDPDIEQPENVELLFEVLEDFSNNTATGVLTSIIVRNCTSCLIVKPIYLGDWGEVEGWYFALGSCSEMKCEEVSKNLKDEAEQSMKRDISSKLEIEDVKSHLQMTFDFPRILGREFEKNDDTIAVIDGDDGFIEQKYDRPPWGVLTSTYRSFPPILRKLDNLDMYLQTETSGILEPEYVPKPKEESPIPTRLLIFTLLYGIFFMIWNLQVSSIILFVDVLILIGVVTRHPSGWVRKWTVIPIMMGLFTMLVPVFDALGYTINDIPELDHLLLLPIGGYILTLGILFGTLYGTKREEKDLES